MATNSVPEWSSIATSKLSTKLSTAPYVSWYYTGKANILLGLPLRYRLLPQLLPQRFTLLCQNTIPQQEMWENQRKTAGNCVGAVAYPWN